MEDYGRTHVVQGPFARPRTIWMMRVRIEARHAMAENDSQSLGRHLRAKATALRQRDRVLFPIHFQRLDLAGMIGRQIFSRHQAAVLLEILGETLGDIAAVETLDRVAFSER